MAKPNRYRGGIATNLDLPEMTPAQRRQAEQDAYNDGLIQDAIARADREGPKPEILVAGQQWTTTFDKLNEKSGRVGNRGSIIPIDVIAGPEFAAGFRWILSDGDMDLIETGHACPYCLHFYPEVWAPACTTCGMDRDLLR